MSSMYRTMKREIIRTKTKEANKKRNSSFINRIVKRLTNSKKENKYYE